MAVGKDAESVFVMGEGLEAREVSEVGGGKPAPCPGGRPAGRMRGLFLVVLFLLSGYLLVEYCLTSFELRRVKRKLTAMAGELDDPMTELEGGSTVDLKGGGASGPAASSTAGPSSEASAEAPALGSVMQSLQAVREDVAGLREEVEGLASGGGGPQPAPGGTPPGPPATGSVIHVDADHGVAVVDLTATEGAHPGMSFAIYAAGTRVGMFRAKVFRGTLCSGWYTMNDGWTLQPEYRVEEE